MFYDTTRRVCCFSVIRYSVSEVLSPLHLLLEPLDELRQGSAAVGDLVLLCFGHFGVRLAFVLEACVPALKLLVPKSRLEWVRIEGILTEISRSTSFNNRALDWQLAML